VIVCKPCANVTPTCDRLGFQIHLSPWKKTCDMHVVMYYLRLPWALSMLFFVFASHCCIFWPWQPMAALI
jgi:hypothetical protein